MRARGLTTRTPVDRAQSPYPRHDPPEGMEDVNNKPIKVLLVEDDPEYAYLMREMLAIVREAPIDLECTDRLSTGLERLTAGDIDVVLLDLSLPDSQGVDTFIKMHAQTPDVPIIVLSGFNDEALSIQIVQEGAQDYLVKGREDSNLLAHAILHAVERRQAAQKLVEVALTTTSLVE